jgi:heavy metal efflux system protein
VVIGGLITATFLTLMVLPALYKLINKPMKTNKTLLTGILLLSAGWASAQTPLGMDDAVAHAIEKHPLMTNANLEVEASTVRQRTAWSLPGTEVMYQYGQQNTRVRDPYLEVNQSLGSPWVNSRQSRFFKELTRQSELQKQRTQAEIVWSVRSQYMEALYRQARAGLQGAQMANYQKVAELTDLRYRAGAISRLDKNLSQAELVNQQSMLTRLYTEALMARQELAKVIFSEDTEVAPADTMYFLLARRGDNSQDGGLWMQLALQEAEVAQSAVRTTQGGRYPEFAVGGYMQRISEPENVMRGLNGVILTARMPLALNAQGARIQEAKLRQQMADNRVALTRQQLDRDRAQLLADLEAYLNQLSAYEKEALPEISEVVDQAMKLYQQGEIDFFRLTQSLEQAWRVRMLYLDTLHACNMTYLQLVLLTA